MMIIASGPEKDLENLTEILKKNYPVLTVSKPYDEKNDVRHKRIYIDIVAADYQTGSTISEYNVIDYCNKWRSKADVMHNFYISYEAAEEILNRLSESGALIRRVVDKHYEHIDSRYCEFVTRKCGNCEHHGSFGTCYKGMIPDGIATDAEYIPVDAPACKKFEPDYMSLLVAATVENYEKIKEGEEE